MPLPIVSLLRKVGLLTPRSSFFFFAVPKSNFRLFSASSFLRLLELRFLRNLTFPSVFFETSPPYPSNPLSPRAVMLGNWCYFSAHYHFPDCHFPRACQLVALPPSLAWLFQFFLFVITFLFFLFPSLPKRAGSLIPLPFSYEVALSAPPFEFFFSC